MPKIILLFNVGYREDANMIYMYKLCKLNDAGGDLSAQWYVYYSFRHPETNRFVRFKQMLSLRLITKTMRYSKASELIKIYDIKLKTGWNPFIIDDLKSKKISDAIDKVIQLKSQSLRNRSIHTYRHLATTFKEYITSSNLTRLNIAEFSSYHAQDFLDWAKTTKKITNRTYNNYLTHIRTFFNLLVEREYTGFNPFKNIKKLQVEQSDITAFSPYEMKIIRENLPHDHPELFTICQLIFYCFIRPAEIMKLTFADFNLQQNKIVIRASASKNKKQQVIVIPQSLVHYLNTLQWNYPPNHYIFSRGLKPGTKQIAPTRIAEAWAKWRKQYGIKKNIYQLKHTGVGMAIEAGINIRDLQLQLRHSSLDMTQIYVEKFNNTASRVLQETFPAF